MVLIVSAGCDRALAHALAHMSMRMTVVPRVLLPSATRLGRCSKLRGRGWPEVECTYMWWLYM